MLIPKRTKYRKPHRISYEGKVKVRISYLTENMA